LMHIAKQPNASRKIIPTPFAILIFNVAISY
jgi:hypothetical protein